MELESLGLGNLNLSFFLSLLNIIVINIILSGDNAVVIALAVRSLPRAQRQRGIIFGAGLAVVLRIVLTFFVSMLLNVEFLKLAGGLLIAWIAFKLLVEVANEDDEGKEATSIWQALRLILVADLTMSLDNVLAVAAASNGNLFLLIFGLALSIPLVIFTSNLLSSLMDRYPIIIILGALVLGRVAGEMIMSDPFIVSWLNPPAEVQYAVEAFFALGVVVAGKLWLRHLFRAQARAKAQNSSSKSESKSWQY